MMIPDRFARTVRLKIRAYKGQIKLADSGDLPELKDGAYGELIVFSSAVIDDKVRKDLTSERVVSFLPSGATLWAKVRNEKLPESLTKFRENRRTWQGEPGLFVPFVLCNELQIIMRGTKFAHLKDCPCDVSPLVRKAESINQAYSMLSAAFEPTRRSHTGNVFQKVFVEQGKWLQSLETLRINMEANPPPEASPGS